MKNTTKKLSIIAIGTIILFLCCIFTITKSFFDFQHKLHIKNLFSSTEAITVNLELKKENQDELMFCFNNFCTNFTKEWDKKSHNIYFHRNNYGNEFSQDIIKNYYLIAKNKDFDKLLENIHSIFVFKDNKGFYFANSDLKKLNKKNLQIAIENENIADYIAIDFSEILNSNYKGYFNHLIIFFLSFFYNWFYLPIPYLGLIFCSILYITRKNEFNFNINNFFQQKYIPILLSIIFTIALILRLNQLTVLPYFVDELYTINVAIENFLSCFKDPGNPPIFYIIEYLISKISNSIIAHRLISVCFGLGFCAFIYLIFKKTSKKFALTMCFLAAINIISISLSQCARVYSFCTFITTALTYFLFNYLKNKEIKKLNTYGILTILAINSHYLIILYCIFNFIYGNIILIKNKAYSELKKFNSWNILASLTLLPYLYLTFSESLEKSFNAWIPPLTFTTFQEIIIKFFVNKELFYIFLFLTIIILIFSFLTKKTLTKLKLRINKNQKQLFLYSLFAIIFIIISSIIISLTIKPMLKDRHLFACYGLFFILQGTIIKPTFSFIIKNNCTKIINIAYSSLIILFLFSITYPDPTKNWHNIDTFTYFLEKDSKFYRDRGYEIHAIMPDTTKYLKTYPQIESLGIITHSINSNSDAFLDRINKEDYTNKKEKVVFYFSTFVADISSEHFKQEKIYTFTNKHLSTCKIIYD